MAKNKEEYNIGFQKYNHRSHVHGTDQKFHQKIKDSLVNQMRQLEKELVNNNG